MTAATRSASATLDPLLSLDQLSLSRATSTAPAIVPAGGELEEDGESLPALSQPSSVASSEDGEDEYTGAELQARAMEAATALLSQFLGGHEVELDHGQRKWRSRSYSYEQEQYDDAPLSRLGLAPVQLLLNAPAATHPLAIPKKTVTPVLAPAATHPLAIPKKTFTPASTPVAISLTPSRTSPVKSSKPLPAKTSSGFLRLQ